MMYTREKSNLIPKFLRDSIGFQIWQLGPQVLTQFQIGPFINLLSS